MKCPAVLPVNRGKSKAKGVQIAVLNSCFTLAYFCVSFMKVFFLIVCIVAALGVAGQPIQKFKFRNGDLLFQDLDCGGLCDAIEAVTTSAQGRHFSHLGLVIIKDDSVLVIEAIGKDVHTTSLQKFAHRQLNAAGNPKITVGRLKKRYLKLNDKALRFAMKQLHKPYDDPFLYNNGKYYCSELIYGAYKYANGGKPFFPLTPMTFNDPATGKPFPAWAAYYNALKISIPEGQPGCNPGSISTSDKIEIIASFY